MNKFSQMLQRGKELLTAGVEKAKKVAAVGVATAGAFFMGTQPAQAQIVITPFTDALDDVGDAVTGGLGATVTAGLAIAGVIMAGLILWRLFKRVAKA